MASKSGPITLERLTATPANEAPWGGFVALAGLTRKRLRTLATSDALKFPGPAARGRTCAGVQRGPGKRTGSNPGTAPRAYSAKRTAAAPRGVSRPGATLPQGCAARASGDAAVLSMAKNHA
jgi:hypothetical protein